MMLRYHISTAVQCFSSFTCEMIMYYKHAQTIGYNISDGTLTTGILGRGPIIGGIGDGIMGAPAIGMCGIGAAAMCGEGVTLFCISLGLVG